MKNTISKIIKTYDTVFEKGCREINEDELVVNEESLLFGVIDGATGLRGVPGKLAANALKVSLISNCQSKLIERINLGNQNIAKSTLEYLNESSNRNITELDKTHRSTCSFAVVEIKPDKFTFEYAQTGDCMIIIMYNDGSIRQVTHERVSIFDSKVIKIIAEYGENFAKHLNHEEFQEMVNEKIAPILTKQRYLLNTIGGYGVLDGSQEAMDFVEYGSISLNGVSQILILSDGLQLPSHKINGFDSWILTARYCFDKGIQSLIEYVNELENADPYCLEYPRIKKADDKSGILIVI